MIMSQVSNRDINKEIDRLLRENDVVLFMKGSRKFPMCGFSGVVVSILERLGVKDIMDIDVLQDSEMRQGIKDYSNWPTLPQLYIKKEFIGGCDIVKEMYDDGELAEILKSHNIIN